MKNLVKGGPEDEGVGERVEQRPADAEDRPPVAELRSLMTKENQKRRHFQTEARYANIRAALFPRRTSRFRFSLAAGARGSVSRGEAAERGGLDQKPIPQARPIAARSAGRGCRLPKQAIGLLRPSPFVAPGSPLVPKLPPRSQALLGNACREAPLCVPFRDQTRNGVSPTCVPKQSLGTRRFPGARPIAARSAGRDGTGQGGGKALQLGAMRGQGTTRRASSFRHECDGSPHP